MKSYLSLYVSLVLLLKLIMSYEWMWSAIAVAENNLKKQQQNNTRKDPSHMQIETKYTA